MIYSDQQYDASVKELAKLRQHLGQDKASRAGMSAGVRQLLTRGLRDRVDRLEAELEYYDILRAGDVTFTRSFSFEELPSTIIEARISQGISQADLAAMLGVLPHVIRQYESTGYLGAPLARIMEICKALNVRGSAFFEGTGQPRSAIYRLSRMDQIAWQRLPLDEMVQRGWLALGADAAKADVTKAWLAEAFGTGFEAGQRPKKLNVTSLPDEYALLAWQARVMVLGRGIADRAGHFDPGNPNGLIAELVALASLPDGPQRAVRVLAQHGIACVVERPLSGTPFDGASMLSGSGHPVIGLTLRNDSHDSYWLNLFHQLAHVILHLASGVQFDFYDSEGADHDDDVESQAEQFVRTHLPLTAIHRSDDRLSQLTDWAALLQTGNDAPDRTAAIGRLKLG